MGYLDDRGQIYTTKVYEELNPGKPSFMYTANHEYVTKALWDMVLDKFDYEIIHVSNNVSQRNIIAVRDPNKPQDKIVVHYFVYGEGYGRLGKSAEEMAKDYSTKEANIIKQSEMFARYDDFDGIKGETVVTTITVISPSAKNSVINKISSLLKTYSMPTALANLKAEDDMIYVILPTNRGLELDEYKIPTETYHDDIIDDNYNDDFKPAYEKLISFLEVDGKPGLTLLIGKPGTGKTSIIHNLAAKAKSLQKKFVILPSAFISVLTDPGFTRFAVEELQDCVLCIEDAEDILKSRKVNPNSAVTNVLNITDGLIGKITNMKIICTLNDASDIDDALLRKGRLQLKYVFHELKVDKAKHLAEKLGKDMKISEPTVLADIYNADEEVEFNQTEKQKVGF